MEKQQSRAISGKKKTGSRKTYSDYSDTHAKLYFVLNMISYAAAIRNIFLKTF